MLLSECAQYNAEIRLGETITKVSKSENSLFEVITSQGQYKADNLVIATGGLPFPKWARRGLPMI